MDINIEMEINFSRRYWLLVRSDDDFINESESEEEKVNMCMMVMECEVLCSFFFCFKIEFFEIIFEFIDDMKELFDKIK